MNLAGFCRNCLSNWMADAAEDKGLELSKDEAREIIYGMPFKNGRRSTRKTRAPSSRRHSRKAGRKANTSAPAICTAYLHERVESICGIGHVKAFVATYP